MPNRNREKGDRFEHLCRTALREQGWLVVRSAGSLGCADLVAFRSDHQPWFISCKATDKPYLTPAEWLQLYTNALGCNAVPVLAWPAAPGKKGIQYLCLMASSRGGRGRIMVRPLDSA
jgi:Holliday junction resolvase